MPMRAVQYSHVFGSPRSQPIAAVLARASRAERAPKRVVSRARSCIKAEREREFSMKRCLA
jgi:hypothetical protein